MFNKKKDKRRKVKAITKKQKLSKKVKDLNLYENKVTETVEIEKKTFHFTWADAYCEVEEKPDLMEEDSLVNVNTKKDLNEYFIKNKQEILVTQKKTKKKKKKQAKLTKHYMYGKTTFRTPQELIEYIEKNPKKLPQLAQTVLDDEIFYNWLGIQTYQFVESVKKFREFKKTMNETT